MSLRVINAVAGILYQGNNILLARRHAHASFPEHWEFPGGKIEAGESPKEALIRELHEEIGVTVNNSEDLQLIRVFKIVTIDAIINLTAYKVFRWENEVRAKELQPLVWHNLAQDFPHTPLLATTTELLHELKVDV